MPFNCYFTIPQHIPQFIFIVGEHIRFIVLNSVQHISQKKTSSEVTVMYSACEHENHLHHTVIETV